MSWRAILSICLQFVFVYVQMDNEDYGEAVSGFFGVTGTAPKVLVYTGNEDTRKFILDGELTVNNIKVSSTSIFCEMLWLTTCCLIICELS